jgi:hypothetical protein
MAKSASQAGFTSYHAPKTARAIVVLLALAVVASVASLIVYVSLPQDAISAHASASEVREATTRAAAFASSKSSAPSRTGAPPDVDYFPNRYVNQATRIEEPSPTF